MKKSLILFWQATWRTKRAFLDKQIDCPLKRSIHSETQLMNECDGFKKRETKFFSNEERGPLWEGQTN